MGARHARVYAEIESCELRGVCDTDSARAARVAGEYGCRAFDDVAGLLAEVDAVSIVVPTTAHHAVARRAIDSGVHTLIEKPIASTLEEARDLIDAARAGATVLQIGHVERFNPAVRAAMAVLREPRFVEAHRLGIFVPRGTDVAVVLDLMIHDIDLVLATVGSDVARIDAAGVCVLSTSADIANARLTFESGSTANVTASRVSREKVRKIRFFERDAYISVDCLKRRVEVFRRKDVSEELLQRIAAGEVDGGLSDVVDYEELPVDDREPLELELSSFLGSIRDGVQPAVTGEDGARALSVALEVLDQVRRRR